MWAWSAVTTTSVSGWSACVVAGDLDRLVERDGLADLAARRCRRGPACRSTRPRPAGRSPSSATSGLRVSERRAPCGSSPARLGSLGAVVVRLHSVQTCGPLAGVAAARPDHSVVMLPGLNRPSTRPWVVAATPARPASVARRRRSPGPAPSRRRSGRRTGRPSRSARSGRGRRRGSRRRGGRRVCSAIEPRPPRPSSRSGSLAMSAGPWQPRSFMCEASTAGVASVISAVETLPVTLAAPWASSRMVGRFSPARRSACSALGDAPVRRSSGPSPRSCRSTRSRGRSRAGSPGRGRLPTSVGRRLAGEREASMPPAAGAVRVVARRGDLGVAHAVAEQEDDVLRRLRAEVRLDALRGVVLSACGERCPAEAEDDGQRPRRRWRVGVAGCPWTSGPSVCRFG